MKTYTTRQLAAIHALVEAVGYVQSTECYVEFGDVLRVRRSSDRQSLGLILGSYKFTYLPVAAR